VTVIAILTSIGSVLVMEDRPVRDKISARTGKMQGLNKVRTPPRKAIRAWIILASSSSGPMDKPLRVDPGRLAQHAFERFGRALDMWIL
jgi:hypothetical protein